MKRNESDVEGVSCLRPGDGKLSFRENNKGRVLEAYGGTHKLEQCMESVEGS